MMTRSWRTTLMRRSDSPETSSRHLVPWAPKKPDISSMPITQPKRIGSGQITRSVPSGSNRISSSNGYRTRTGPWSIRLGGRLTRIHKLILWATGCAALLVLALSCPLVYLPTSIWLIVLLLVIYGSSLVLLGLLLSRHRDTPPTE